MGCLSMDGQPIFLFFGKLGFGRSKRNGFSEKSVLRTLVFTRILLLLDLENLIKNNHARITQKNRS